LTSCLLLAASAGAQNSTNPPFDWSSITPSTNLSWVDCYQSPLQCTRFSVPLNYSNPEAGSAAIAVIRVPSPVAGTPSYRGPVLFNPGGPGGSGVETVVAAGVNLQRLIGQEFDFVGFDPRGISETTPNIDIWTSDEEHELYLRNFFTTYDISQESWPVLPGRLKNITAFNARIKDRAGDVIQHVTTDNVARDMLSIVEAHGRDKLQYYGVSYGSALGSIFASMFPDKIERLLIDGMMEIPFESEPS
jgi:pimeloyl-ACP methyl ester carboxylesterase